MLIRKEVKVRGRGQRCDFWSGKPKQKNNVEEGRVAMCGFDKFAKVAISRGPLCEECSKYNTAFLTT
jgi:hypothetical protein